VAQPAVPLHNHHALLGSWFSNKQIPRFAGDDSLVCTSVQRERRMGRSMLRPYKKPSRFVSTRAVKHEPVQSHWPGLECLKFDLREMAFVDFAPTVNAGFSFLNFAAVQVA